MKKQLQLIVYVCMVLAGLTGYGQQVGDTFDAANGIKYQITELGSPYTVMIVDYLGSATVVNIPDTVTYQSSDFKVTSIRSSAFQANDLTSVTIPNGVISIGGYAFAENFLESVTIPNSVTIIGIRAFLTNDLSSVTIGQDVTTIGGAAFADNQKLATVVLEGTEPPSLGSYGVGGTSGFTDAFTNPHQIDVIVPRGSLDNFVPAWDSFNFKSITEEVANSDSFIVEGITYKITALGSPSLNMVTITDNTNTGDLTIPGTVTYGPNDFEVTRIEDYAFQGNALTSVTIPESVTDIEGAAFTNNPDLVTVVLEGTNPPLIEESTFEDRNQIDLVVPKDALNDYKTAWDSLNFKSITGEKGVGETFTVNGIAYEITALGSPGPNTVTITGYQNTATSVKIPKTITYQGNGFEVTRIGDDAFQDNALTSVDIPDSVTSIGQRAFQNNQLTSVIIPESVETIDDWAFANNPGLTKVGSERTDPPSIEENTFEDRNQIAVIVPKDTKTAYENEWGTDFKPITEEGDVDETFIDNGIGYRITSLSPRKVMVTGRAGSSTATDITIPATVANGLNYAVTLIGANAFVNDQLSSITIGQNVALIRGGAFWKNNLTSVTIPGSVKSIGGLAFAENALTSVTIQNGVKSIEAGAFQTNKLTSVTMPESVTAIWGAAFADNQDFATIVLEGTEPPNLGSYGVGGNSGFTDAFTDRLAINVIVPVGARDNYLNHAVGWMGFESITEDVSNSDSFTIEGITYQVNELNPNTVTITDYQNQNAATSVNIPETITHEGNDFEITRIGDDAFQDNALTSVEIPDSVTRIGDYAFQGNALTSVTIPESVTSIGFGAFSVCGLSSVHIPEGVTSIEDSAFRNNRLTSVTIPNSVTSIGVNAFAFNKLTRFTISSNGNGISIGDGALCHNNLSSVTLPSSVTSIGQNVFKDNPDLATVVSKRTDPPSIQVETFINAGRDKIDVFVPKGTLGDYQDSTKGWTDFKSITEGIGVSIEAQETTNLSTFTVTFRFDLDVTGFTMDDIDLINATADNFTGSGSVYTVEITPTSCNGAVQIDIPANAAEYAPSFPNLAGSTTVTVNALLPVAPTISTNSSICPGGNAVFTITGTPGDMVTYNGALSGTVAIEADGTVDVTVNGAGSDTTLNLMEVTNGSCSMPLARTATVTVQDNPLTAIARDITVELDASGQASITPEQVDNGSHGNCSNGLISLSLDRTGFSCDDIDSPGTVTLTATSGNNAPATATAVIEIVDRMPPTAIAKDLTVQLDASGRATITTMDMDNGSFDNCGIAHMSLSQEVFNSTGTFPVTLTVADSSGNQHTATATVTVEAYPAEISHVFTVSDMDYKITSMNPHTVTVTGISGTNTSGRSPAISFPGTITIPETVIHGGSTYIVTGIGDGAFENSNLTSVDIGRNVTSIGTNAFRGNQLTSVTIPASVTSIGDNAFTDNPLASVLVLADTPPELNFYDVFSDPDTIELTVPADRINTYRTAGWTGFESISDGITLIIGEPEKENFTTYPNPARDKVHIDLGSGKELKQVNIYTTVGAYLYSENGPEINTGRLSKGVYLFEIVTKTGDRSIKKIVIADR